MNIEVHFVGYLHIMDLINAWKMEHIKITSLFLISNFHNVLIVVFFLLADSLASKFYVPMFWSRQSVPIRRHKIQTSENHPEERISSYHIIFIHLP
jgi:hypothetical protein